MTEPTHERDRRIYSAAYQEGQRLSSHRSALAKAEDDAAKYDHDPYFRSLGSHCWTDGFRDGWNGRVPARELRLSDLPFWQS